jgi:hypothetical protein
VKDAELSIRQRYAALEAENRAGKDKEKALKDSTTDEKLMKSFSKVGQSYPSFPFCVVFELILQSINIFLIQSTER